MSGTPEQPPARRRSGRMLFVPAGALLQAAGLAVLFGKSGATGTFLLLHFAGAAVAAAGLFPKGAKRADLAGFLLLNGALASILPVAGVVASAFLERIILIERDDSGRSDHILWDGGVTHHVPGYGVDADIDALKEPHLLDSREDHIDTGGDMFSAETLPYRLRDRDPEVRRSAIRPLVHLRTDHAASILREVADDHDEQVRLLAQNALQTIRDRHDEILTALVEAVEKHPDDPLVRLRLADSYSALAEMNLDRDAEAAGENRARAARAIDEATRLLPSETRPETALRLVRRSLILGRSDLALRFADDASRLAPDDTRLKEARIELAYIARDWPLFLSLLKSSDPAPLMSPLFRTVKDFWLDDAKEDRP